MTDLRYPIGPFKIDELESATSEDVRRKRISALAETPALLERAIAGLSEVQLDSTYRPGGWTVRQVIHHMADSHLQAYVVFKRTLTEDQPLLRMYDCTAWGEFLDSKTAPAGVSLALLRALHLRWDGLLNSMKAQDFTRVFERPEWGGLISLDNLLQMLEWHQRHHLAHIASARKRVRCPAGGHTAESE